MVEGGKEVVTVGVVTGVVMVVVVKVEARVAVTEVERVVEMEGEKAAAADDQQYQ